MTDSNREKADEIEQDIVKTQNSISDTVEKLKERFTPQAAMKSIFGEENPGFDQIVEAAKRNPFAVTLIAAGAAWLASGKGASLPSMGKGSDKQPKDRAVHDPHHRGYVDHMAQMEIRENEPPHIYQQRRDVARANYFMLERNDNEDDTSFRKRLDEAGDGLRQRTSAFGQQAREKSHDLKQKLTDTGESARQGARAAADKSRELYDDNPIVGGLVAAVVGALAGVTIPTTRVEQDSLGEIADGAMSKVADQKNKLVHEAEASLETTEA